MDWLMPAESNIRTDLNLGGGGGFDSIYKPYSVEPLVSRYNFGSVTSNTGSNGLGSTLAPGGGVPGGLAPLNPRRNTINSLRNLGRNAALDDIDELTLAVETKNFLGSQAIPIPSTNYLQPNGVANGNNQTENGSNFLNDMYADTNGLYGTGNQDTMLIGGNPLLNNNRGPGGMGSNLYQNGNYNGNFMSNPAPASLSTIYGQPIMNTNQNLGSVVGSNGNSDTHDYLASPTKMFLSNPLFNKDLNSNNNNGINGLAPKLRNNGSSEHRSSDYDPYQSLKYQPNQFRSLSNGSYQGLQPLGQQFTESPNHNNHQQRLIQYQNRVMQDQQYQPSNMMMNNNNNYANNFNGGMNDYGQLPPQPKPYTNGNYGNGSNGSIYAQNNNNNNNNGYYDQFSNDNDWNIMFNDNQMKKKHYSELSIQSTSADPLNSNAPTPLVNTNGRRQASNNNNNQQYQSNFQKNLVNTNSMKPMEGVNNKKPNGNSLPGIKQNNYQTNTNRSNNQPTNQSQRTRRNGSNEFINNIYSASSIKSGPNQSNRSQKNDPYNVSSNLNNQTRENKVKSKSLNNGLNEHRDNYFDVLNYNDHNDINEFNSPSNNGGFNYVDDNQFINNYQQKNGNTNGYQNGNGKLKRNPTINGNGSLPGVKNQGDDFYRKFELKVIK